MIVNYQVKITLNAVAFSDRHIRNRRQDIYKECRKMYQKKELRLLQMLDAMTSFPPSYDQKI